MINVTNVAKCRGEISFGSYHWQTQGLYTPDANHNKTQPILNSDWLHALTPFSPNSDVLLELIAHGAM